MNKKLILLSVITTLGSVPFFGAAWSGEESADQMEVKALVLVPAHEPVPAMAHQLLLGHSDQKAGNAALFYYSAAALCPNEDPGEVRKKIDSWRGLPTDQLPREELEKVLAGFTNCFHYLELAAHRDQCHWDMPLEDGYDLQLPALSVYRSMAMAMQLKIRLLIADGKMEQALAMLQHGLHMGRGIAQGPSVIQGLVGTAITALMLKEIEGLLQMPGSPNLYWALTALPVPLVDMYPSLEIEREILFIELPQLRDLETEHLSPGQASAAVSKLLDNMQSLGAGMDETPFKGLVPTGWVMMHYAAAKAHLAHRGFSLERIETMPAAQAVLIYQKQEYLDMLDGMFKWFTVPYYQAQPHLERSEQQLDDHQKAKGIRANLFSFLLPALSRIAFLEARLDRHIALLRTIEAIRLYAADHSGQVPGSLGDIAQVPIPIDPVTGRAFLYQRKDLRSARLEAPVSPAERKKRPVYDLTVRP
jgi:hypothetical protein